jgi:hypothetical protein
MNMASKKANPRKGPAPKVRSRIARMMEEQSEINRVTEDDIVAVSYLINQGLLVVFDEQTKRLLEPSSCCMNGRTLQVWCPKEE